MLLGHRYYDSFTGRFITRDPIGYGGGINLYGFTGNNPVNESDPSGFEPPIKGDPDDPTGLPRDDEGHWHGSTMNPSVHDGTHEARRANAMRRSAVSVFFGALMAVVNPEAKALEAVGEAFQAARIAKTEANIVESGDYNQARNKSLQWLMERGFKAEKPVIARLGPNAGKAIGMSTADGSVGYRIEYDKIGPHINVFDHNAPKMGVNRNLPHFTFPGTQNTVNRIIRRF